MLEQKKGSTSVEEENKELDKLIALNNQLIPLDNTEKEIVNKIIEADNKDELKHQFDLFNMNQSKKNALRVIKLNGLLGKIEDQAIERFEKRPDQISNKELLDYMQVVSTQIEKSQNYISDIQDKPMITVNNQKNELNVSIGPELDRDSKSNVINAVTNLLNQLRNKSVSNSESESNNDIIVDTQDVEIVQEDQNFSENNVLLNTEDNSEEEIK